MKNHFHLVMETPNANLVAGMRWLLSAYLGENHSGELRRESAESKAQRILVEEMSRLKWCEGDLASRPRNEPGKLVIAARLRRETTLPIKWIAAQVQLGTSKSANASLHDWMRTHDSLTPGQLQPQPMTPAISAVNFRCRL
jgi:hypothetical protein